MGALCQDRIPGGHASRPALYRAASLLLAGDDHEHASKLASVSVATIALAQLDHLERGIVMSLYEQSSLLALAVLVVAIPLIGIRFIARRFG